ncbi:MAG TPA: YitT family protein [Candidatus Fimousia stercorigallinarum]|nr:YitT family protein [Candidatus Fimousia stercorigallinarum]
MNHLSMNILKRYLLLLVGLSIMAFGVAFSIKASLGTSPISSVPYVVSLFTPFTVGTATIIMHCVFIFIQILILQKRYQLIQLMQLPVAFFFGYLTDFGVWAVQGISYEAYWQQWILCLIGILLVAIGVSLEVKANVVVLAGEGVVLAICQAIPIKFGYMKVGFDVTLVVIACVLSLVFTGHLYGVREGTIAAAIMVGLIAKQIGKIWEVAVPEKATSH